MKTQLTFEQIKTISMILADTKSIHKYNTYDITLLKQIIDEMLKEQEGQQIYENLSDDLQIALRAIENHFNNVNSIPVIKDILNSVINSPNSDIPVKEKTIVSLLQYLHEIKE